MTDHIVTLRDLLAAFKRHKNKCQLASRKDSSRDLGFLYTEMDKFGQRDRLVALRQLHAEVITKCNLNRGEMLQRPWQEFVAALRQLRLDATSHTPSGAAPVVAELETPKGDRRKRGRPSHTDVATDRRLVEAWKTNQYRKYAELAKAMGTTPKEVKNAIDRHRKSAGKNSAGKPRQ